MKKQVNHPGVVSSFVLIVIFFAGCASENLQLDNIFQAEAERAARIKAKEGAAAQKAEEASHEEMKSEQKNLPKENFAGPEELKSLIFLNGFERVDKAERLKWDESQEAKEYYPSFSLLWRLKDGSIKVLYSVVKMNVDDMLSTSKTELEEQAKDGVKVFEKFYREKRNSGVTFRSLENNNIITFEVVSKYLTKDVWQTDRRLTFFYRPDYRLNLMITGNDDKLIQYRKEIEEGLDAFLKQLVFLYPDGISFKSPDDID